MHEIGEYKVIVWLLTLWQLLIRCVALLELSNKANYSTERIKFSYQWWLSSLKRFERMTFVQFWQLGLKLLPYKRDGHTTLQNNIVYFNLISVCSTECRAKANNNNVIKVTTSQISSYTRERKTINRYCKCNNNKCEKYQHMVYGKSLHLKCT